MQITRSIPREDGRDTSVTVTVHTKVGQAGTWWMSCSECTTEREGQLAFALYRDLSPKTGEVIGFLDPVETHYEVVQGQLGHAIVAMRKKVAWLVARRTAHWANVPAASSTTR